MSCGREPTIRKSFAIRKQDVACAAPMDSGSVAAGSSTGALLILATSGEPRIEKWIGHRGAITSIATSGNSGLATGSVDGDVRIWYGRDESVSLGFGTQIDDIALSHHFERLAVCSSVISVYDPGSLSVVAKYEDRASCVAISGDGLLVSSGSVRGIKLYDLRASGAQQMIEAPETVCVGIRGNGGSIAAGSVSGHVTLWDLRAHNVIKEAAFHKDAVTGCRFHPSKGLLLTTSLDGNILVASADSGDLIYTLSQCHESGVSNASWSPNGEIFTTTGKDNRVVLWDEPIVVPTSRPEPPAVAPTPVPQSEEFVRKTMMSLHQITSQCAALARVVAKIDTRLDAMDRQIVELSEIKGARALRTIRAARD